MIAWLMIKAVGLFTRATGRPHEGQCIYVANHTSHLDVLRLLSALPANHHPRPVAAEEYWTAGPIRRWLIHSIVHGVLIERDRVQLNPLEPAANALRAGDSLIFFPEGTRGKGPDLQPLKPGIFYLAKWFPEVPIIPAWIGPRTVTFGPPLPKQDQQEEFLASLRQTLEGLRP